MIKRTIALIITAVLVSAGLVFLGTTVMGQFSPALASPLNALVAGTNLQTSPVSAPVEEKSTLKNELSSGAENPKVNSAAKPTSVPPTQPPAVTPVAKATATPPVSPTQPLKVSNSATPGAAPITGVTIAQLLKNPGQYYKKVFTITGIATRLSNEKFLLNDGTGQILVEVDSDLGKYVVVSGLSVTITGAIDDISKSGVKVDAYKIIDQRGTFVIDDCDDDCNDDCDDALDDDCNDDSSDDSDDDSDDDSEDDSDDDSNTESDDNSDDDKEDD